MNKDKKDEFLRDFTWFPENELEEILQWIEDYKNKCVEEERNRRTAEVIANELKEYLSDNTVWGEPYREMTKEEKEQSEQLDKAIEEGKDIDINFIDN